MDQLHATMVADVVAAAFAEHDLHGIILHITGGINATTVSTQRILVQGTVNVQEQSTCTSAAKPCLCVSASS